MVRVVTQETYDEVVKENIDEFDMSPEDAVKDAIAQFEAQGVDLSNIIKDLMISTNGEDNSIVKIISNILDSIQKDVIPIESLENNLESFAKECSKGIEYKIRAGKEGAYSLLLRCYDATNNDKVKIKVLKGLAALMDGQPDLLDVTGLSLMKKILIETKDDEIMNNSLRWMSMCCLKHENNRQNIFKINLIGHLKELLEKEKMLPEALKLIRRLALDDDIRVEFGKAHDHAKEMATHLLTKLTRLLKDNLKSRNMTSDLVQAIASLLVRHEFCQMFADADGCQAVLSILTDYYEDAGVVQQAFKLIKALSGNDDVKKSLVKCGISPLVVSLVDKNMSNTQCCKLGLACISLMALREPTHSTILFDCGAHEVICQAMNVHPNDVGIQRTACWAVRNMVARNKEQRSKFLEHNIEQLLNESNSRFSKEFGFDIKSALRDLDCDVRLDEQWKGTGVQMAN